MLTAIVKFSLVNSIRLSESPLAMELTEFVEGAFVDVEVVFVLIPLESSERFIAVGIHTVKLMVGASLVSRAVKGIVTKASMVREGWGLIISLFALCLVIGKLSLVERSIREYEYAFAVSPSVLEISDVE